MNVVFATDRGYLQHLAVALASLLENNSGMNIYIINNDISDTDWKKLEKLLVGKDSKLIDIKIDDRQIENLVTHSYFTKAMYYRLFIPEIIVGERALYLDADIVVNGQIDDLYNTDISNTFIAAVHNPGINNHNELGMESSAKYFNSGVMLLNLQYWRTGNVKEKVIEFICGRKGVVQFPDQDGLNHVINGNWLELHPKYNLHTVLLCAEYAWTTPVKEAIDNPVIIHHTGSSKPWHFADNHPYKHLYWKYLRMTPYKFTIPSKPLGLLSLNNLKRMIPKPMKDGLKKIVRREN
ncbi:MAG: glycosyltransferase family 8 protein [Smithella sp.]|jgi:lipopolysaccharide biosynthesis glycosyltransferase